MLMASHRGGAANFGWSPTHRSRTRSTRRGPGPTSGSVDCCYGISAIFTGVNLTATIFYYAHPGMTMFRMPIFTWNMLVTAILILLPSRC